MRRTFFTRRAVYSSSWSYPRNPNSQQRRQEQTHASLKKALVMVDELLELDLQNKSEEKEPSRNDDIQLPWNLPISPLMDPKVIAARERRNMTKWRPCERQSAYNKKLSSNPYAQALASPVRACALTGVRLPRYFLINFGVADHPETGVQWHLPQSSASELKRAKEVAFSKFGTEEDVTRLDERKPGHVISGCYYICSRSAMQVLSSFRRRMRIRFTPARWRTNPSLKLTTMVWREDMDTFVLNFLRKNLLKQLKYCLIKDSFSSSYKSTHLRLDPGSESRITALLWLGNRTPTASPISTDVDTYFSDLPTPIAPDPPPYSTALCHGRHVPIFNLPALLDPQRLERALELLPPFTVEAMYVKETPLTMAVTHALWKLMAYMGVREEEATRLDLSESETRVRE